MTWDLSCPDWKERQCDGRSLVPTLPLFQAEADRAVAIFNKLRLADVPGTPTMGEAGGEWFRDIVRALFGSVDRARQQRMIQELFLLVAKKNNKTTGGALLMLTALLLNERPYAPFILTGPVQDTAATAYDAAAGAIELDDVLKAKFQTRDHLKTIVHRETKAELQIVTFDPSILTGRKVAGLLLDELHVLGKMARASKALLQLRGGMQPFWEAFFVTITTQSDEAPAGVFASELTRARAVRDGDRHGDPLLPVLYEFPQEVQQDPAKPWRDPKLWPMVTPNRGLSIDIDRLHRAFVTAQENGEAAVREWASQHLNIQIGVALHVQSWAGAEFWEACAGRVATLDELLERSEVVVVGGDGGGLDDLLGQAVIGRETGTGRWLLWTHAWAHRIALERRKEIASKLQQLADAGELTIVDRPGEDVEAFADNVERIEASGLLADENAVGVDQAGIGAIVDAIVDRKIAVERIIGIPQGWRLMGAIKTVERKLAAGELEHGGTQLMAWCVGNAKAEPRGNAVMITKAVSGVGKIDPLMATFDAAALMGMNPKPRRKKYQAFVI